MHDLLDSRLAPAIEAERLKHLETCAECLESVNRIGAVIASGASLRQPAFPETDLWPAIARRTVRSRVGFRGPWRFTIPFAVLVISLTSLWVVENRPWKRVTAATHSANAAAKDLEALRRLSRLRTLESSVGKREALEDLRSRVFATRDPATRTEFFSIVATIDSDADRSKMLVSLSEYSADTAVARSVIEAALSIESSAERATVLTALVDAGAISTAGLRDLYFGSASSILSKAERERAMNALNREN